MTTELTILAAYGLLIIAMLFLQIALVIQRMGIMFVASPRDDAPKVGGIAGRAIRTVDNSVVAMALFAPAVLALYVQEAGTAGTETAAIVFFVARVLFIPVYLSGVYFVRGPVWMTGLFATAYLYLQAIPA
ncbi:MAG: MAPEG family protein [Paracoccaceae bacterium]